MSIQTPKSTIIATTIGFILSILLAILILFVFISEHEIGNYQLRIKPSIAE